MLCKSCHYPLKQLSEPRCPECGLVFDPDDPRTYEVPQPLTKKLWFRLLVIGCLTYLVMFLVTLNQLLDTHAQAVQLVNTTPGASITFIPETVPSKILRAAGIALLNWPCGFIAAFVVYITVTWATPYLIPRGLKSRRP